MTMSKGAAVPWVRQVDIGHTGEPLARSGPWPVSTGMRGSNEQSHSTWLIAKPPSKNLLTKKEMHYLEHYPCSPA